MTRTVYNTLYDNSAYNRMALAIADHMGVNYDSPSQDYLDIMIAIQDKAIGYSKLEPIYFPINVLRICYHPNIYSLYVDFMGAFAAYYQNNK